MTSIRDINRRARDGAASRLFGVALIGTLGWLLAACSIPDLFDTTSGDDQPAPAATPAESDASDDFDRDARRATTHGHRFFFAPPVDFDPDSLEAARTPEEQRLDELAERWSDTDTVHFELEIDGTTHLDADGNIELKSADGDLKRPDQARANADVGISFASFDVDLVVIGDEAYMTNFLNGNWERAPANFGFNPALIFDDERGISAVVEDIDNPQLDEDAEVDGHAAVQISGTVAQRAVSNLVAGALEGDEIHVALWMDPETHDLLRISLREPDDAPGDPTTWVITFSNHNAPVTIETPDL